MKKIGIISDTHGYINPKLYDFLKEVDEIWHAGDIGSMEVVYELEAFKPLIAVHGNIDDYEMQRKFPEFQRFTCESVDVLITHIGGYPTKYEEKVKQILISNPPKLFISGHSHILKVINDKKYNLLHINPGAAGNRGMHNIVTMIRLVIDGSIMKDLEILELER